MANLNNKYNNSMIYSIRSPHTDKFYIGSTTQKLCKRFTNHKSDYNAYVNNTGNYITSFKIIELGDSYIELLERFDCEDKNELEKREGELIRLHKDLCINKNMAGRTLNQYYLDNPDKSKQYYINNIDKITQYRLDNIDKIKQYSKQHYLDNADKKKQYQKVNAHKINQRKRQQRLDKKTPKINIAKEDYDFLIYCDKLMNIQYSYKHFIIV